MAVVFVVNLVFPAFVLPLTVDLDFPNVMNLGFLAFPLFLAVPSLVLAFIHFWTVNLAYPPLLVILATGLASLLPIIVTSANEEICTWVLWKANLNYPNNDFFPANEFGFNFRFG